ncbi:MAG: Coq4 family protein [Myxococcota bacterium]
MSRWNDFRRLVATARNGGSPGDVALLKAELFGAKMSDAARAQLASTGVLEPMPRLELAALRRLPANTLGRAYASMLDACGLQPFSISDDLSGRAEKHLALLRYVATHDFIHVVTGFDTGWAGEIGVLAATVEQDVAPGGVAQEWAARAYYFVRDFGNRAAIAKNRLVGRTLGAKAGPLLGFRYEDHLETPLSQVRGLLDLPEPADAGVEFALTPVGA